MPGKPRRVYTTRKPIDYLTGSRMPSARGNMYNPMKAYASGGMVEGYQLGGMVKDDDEDYTMPKPREFTMSKAKPSGFTAEGARERFRPAIDRFGEGLAARYRGRMGPGQDLIRPTPPPLHTPRTTASGPGMARRQSTSAATPSDARTIYQAVDRARTAGRTYRQGELPPVVTTPSVEGLPGSSLPGVGASGMTTGADGSIPATGFIPATRDDYLPDEAPDTMYSGLPAVGAGDFGTSVSGLSAARPTGGQTSSGGSFEDNYNPVTREEQSEDSGRSFGEILGDAFIPGYDSGSGSGQYDPSQYQSTIYDLFFRSSAGLGYLVGEDDVGEGQKYYEDWRWDPEVGDYVGTEYIKDDYAFDESREVTLREILDRELPALERRVENATDAQKDQLRAEGVYDLIAQARGEERANELFEIDTRTAEERFGEFEPPEYLPDRISDAEKNSNAARAAERVQASVGRSLRGLTEKMAARGATVGQMAGVVNDAQGMAAAAVGEAAQRSELADRAHNLAIDMQIMAAEISYNQMLASADINKDAQDRAFDRARVLQGQQQAFQQEMIRLQSMLNTPTLEDRLWQLTGAVVGAGSSALMMKMGRASAPPS